MKATKLGMDFKVTFLTFPFLHSAMTEMIPPGLSMSKQVSGSCIEILPVSFIWRIWIILSSLKQIQEWENHTYEIFEPVKPNKENQSEPFIKLLLTSKLKSVYLSTVFFLTSQCGANYKYVYIFTYNTYNTVFCACIISLFSFLTFT